MLNKIIQTIENKQTIRNIVKKKYFCILKAVLKGGMEGDQVSDA